jgi:hypothetical protein
MATRSFINTYRYGALMPATNVLSALSRADWESYSARQFRYLHYDLYYFNTVFTVLENYRMQHLRDRGLYVHTRGLYNPVFRLVEIYAAKCYGGQLDWEDMSGGSVPLLDASPAIVDALRNLWKWSNFGEKKVLYGRQGARFGDAPIKVVDDREKGKVRLEFLHPGLIRDAEVDAAGHIKAVVIEYEKLDPETNRPYLYREEIDQDHFATYRDNELHPFYTDANGQKVAEWDNPYGFVPLVVSKAKDIGLGWGAVPFVGGVLDKIDQVNDLASLTADQVRKTVNAMWYFAGANSIKQVQETTISTGEDDQSDREEVPALTGPAGSQPYPMVVPLDISGALAKIELLLKEIEQDLPELSLHRMREFSQHSAPAVLLVFGDAIDRLTEVRGNLDAGLLRAFQMALTIGGIGRYPGFEAFGPDDYAKGNLDFQIADRPIVRDTLSKKEKLDFFVQTEAPEAWVWEELGKTDAEIARAESDLLARERTAAAEVARVLATGALNGDEDDGDETA